VVIIHIPRADGNTNPMEKRELSSYLSVLRRLWRRLLTAPALLAYLLLLVLVTVTTAGESLLSGDGFITPSEPLPYLLFKYLFFPFLTFLIALYYYRCHHRPEEGKEDIPVYNPRWEGLLILFLYFLWLVFVATKLLTNRYLLPLNHILANFLEGSSLVSLWFAALLQFFTEVLVVKLLPALIIFKVFFRYRWRDLGVGWHWGWTVTGFLALLVAGALLWRREPAPGYGFLLGNFFIQLGTVAFPEEFFYRGLMQPRLERFFADPLHGLVVATLLFGLAHFPHLLFQGYTVPQALVTSLFYQGNAGLLFGVLYYKTRNLGPLVLLHALFNSWG
jgi:membrane protease YdiL (CAAX protease family)